MKNHLKNISTEYSKQLLENNFYLETYLTEVSEYAPEKLRNIDKLFNLYIKTKFSIESKYKLSEAIRSFTKIKNINIVDIRDNTSSLFAIYPEYKSDLPKTVYDAIKDITQTYNTNNDAVIIDELKKIKYIREPVDAIKSITIFINVKKSKFFTGSELTSIFLHELGHSLQKISNIPYFMVKMSKYMLGLIATGKVTYDLFSGLYFPVLYISLFTIVYTLSYLDKSAEIRADSYAAKYGYGDELISVLYKLGGKKTTRSDSKTKDFLNKILLFIYKYLLPGEHPPIISRINNLKKLIKTELKDLYPSYYPELDRIVNKNVLIGSY